MEFELGQTYSGYKFLDVVTRSRTAVQYRVQNTLAQRVESLRTPTAAAGDDPDAAERFLREVRIRARLSHPHIVTFYTAVPIEGRMAMTTEIADWLSLAERLKLGPLPWPEALDIARQLLDALACIHQQSFVHCDITPENILLGAGGFCKLADFSLARPLGPAQTPDSGAVVGNPRYISPEQVKGEGNLDPRSDLYSAGVVLYEMLCGRPPFASRSHFELMMAHVLRAPAPPSTLQPNVPRFFDAVVLKALAKDARDRYPSAAAFSDAIAAAVAEARVEPAPLAAQPVPTVSTAPAVVEAAMPEPEAIPAPEVVPKAEAVIAEAAAPAPEATEAADVTPAGALQTVPSDTGSVAEPEPVIAPDLAVSPEAAPVGAEAAVVPEPVAAPALKATPEPALAIAEAPEAAPAMVEAAVVPVPVAEPAPELACEPALAMVEVPEPAPAMVEAAVVPVPVAVPALEATPEPALAIAEAPEAAPVMVEAAVMPEPVAIPAPEPACEPALAIVEVPEPAPAMVETAVVAEPPAIPASEAAAAPPPPDPALAPPDALQNNLWAAAAMVAEAASTHVAPVPAAAPAPLPLAAPTPDPFPVPQLAPAPVPEAGPLPVFMTTLRRVPDSLQWAVFGGAAAFLGVIWVAIWFATGK
ncbi:MAG: protein kinase [Candidatus Solibacter sp.]